MTITLVTLLKRRTGMSKANFIAYYEEHHRLIGERVLAGHATRYVRRFLHPLDGEDRDYDADVVMEIDFPDRAALDAFFAAAADPATAALIAADEERLFVRSRIRSFTVEEHASDL
ncbi:MAG: EthD domain-containing protein [Sphingomonadales bacterium]|nr:EthD domain-containing protein [Sphingomonadales bacterium]